ncbi:MAG TPA: hypothetical protein PKZ97_03250 [Azospirillaceae bacterium]|nr:hypothetical protein [Azospirillaceae bacterium]HRQ80110.1 hypothetical protein [Azospirillaceae bacterium]
MDVKSAVSEAKKWLADVMAEEHIGNIGLEGVEFDERDSVWRITLGFSRPLNKGMGGAFAALNGAYDPQRVYRIVSVKEPDGKVLSMKRPSEMEM